MLPSRSAISDFGLIIRPFLKHTLKLDLLPEKSAISLIFTFSASQQLENISELSEVTMQDHNATPVSPLIGDYKYHFFDMDWAKSNAKEKEKKKSRKLGKQNHWRRKR